MNGESSFIHGVLLGRMATLNDVPHGHEVRAFANVVEIARRCAEFPVVAAPGSAQWVNDIQFIVVVANPPFASQTWHPADK